MSSRGKTKAQENSRIDLYPPKNKDPFYYKVINGKQYSYRYMDYGKDYVASKAKYLIKRGYAIRIEYLGNGGYIIWSREK